MEKKGAFNLSIEIIVIVIISLVILSAGLLLLKKFIEGAEDTKILLDAKTEDELKRLLIDENKLVALSKNTAALYPGESHVFGLGILNIDGEKGKQFSISIALSKALNQENQDMTQQVDTANWPRYNSEPISIKENEHWTEPILIKVPPEAKKGTYIFNVKVSRYGQNPPYDTIKKINLVVR